MPKKVLPDDLAERMYRARVAGMASGEPMKRYVLSIYPQLSESKYAKVKAWQDPKTQINYMTGWANSHPDKVSEANKLAIAAAGKEGWAASGRKTGTSEGAQQWRKASHDIAKDSKDRGEAPMSSTARAEAYARIKASTSTASTEDAKPKRKRKIYEISDEEERQRERTKRSSGAPARLARRKQSAGDKLQKQADELDM